MAHSAQQDYCRSVKARFPDQFRNKLVLDIGSLDVNGNNRFLFEDCEYTGIDVAAGPNVDIVTPAHKHDVPNGHYDTIITTEALEHDYHWMATLKAVRRMLKSGGLFLLTCATTGRGEHGTSKVKPADCPGIPWEWYRNITEADIRWRFSENYPMEGWGAHEFKVNPAYCDLYAYMVRV
jgi:hypothetical protein